VIHTDGDVELIENGKALLAQIADTYIAKRTASIDTDDELPEIRFYYEGVEVRCYNCCCHCYQPHHRYYQPHQQQQSSAQHHFPL